MTGLRALLLVVLLAPAVPASAALTVEMSVGDAEGAAGQSVTVPVTLAGGAFDPTTIVFDLRYDRFKVTIPDNGVDLGPAAGDLAQHQVFNDQGRVTFIFSDWQELSDGVLCYVTFKILDGPAADIPITFDDVSLTNADVAGGIPFVTHDGAIHSTGEADTRADCFGLFDKALNEVPEGEFNVEAAEAAKALPVLDGAAGTALDTGSTGPWRCAGRIWLPLDQGIFASDVGIYYFDAAADAWMDAEAAGIVAAGSYAQRVEDGVAHIGFLARQGGVFQAAMRVRNEGAAMDGIVIVLAIAAMMMGARRNMKKRNGINR